VNPNSMVLYIAKYISVSVKTLISHHIVPPGGNRAVSKCKGTCTCISSNAQLHKRSKAIMIPCILGVHIVQGVPCADESVCRASSFVWTHRAQVAMVSCYSSEMWSNIICAYVSPCSNIICAYVSPRTCSSHGWPNVCKTRKYK